MLVNSMSSLSVAMVNPNSIIVKMTSRAVNPVLVRLRKFQGMSRFSLLKYLGSSLSVARNKTRVGNQEMIDLVKQGVKSGVPSIPVSHVTLMFQKSDPQNSLILSP